MELPLLICLLHYRELTLTKTHHSLIHSLYIYQSYLQHKIELDTELQQAGKEILDGHNSAIN